MYTIERTLQLVKGSLPTLTCFVTKLKCVIDFEQTPCCRILNKITISMAMQKEINPLYTNDDILFVNYSMIAHVMITHVCINKMNPIPLFYFHIWLTVTHLILTIQTLLYNNKLILTFIFFKERWYVYSNLLTCSLSLRKEHLNKLERQYSKCYRPHCISTTTYG